MNTVNSQYSRSQIEKQRFPRLYISYWPPVIISPTVPVEQDLKCSTGTRWWRIHLTIALKAESRSSLQSGAGKIIPSKETVETLDALKSSKTRPNRILTPAHKMKYASQPNCPVTSSLSCSCWLAQKILLFPHTAFGELTRSCVCTHQAYTSPADGGSFFKNSSQPPELKKRTSILQYKEPSSALIINESQSSVLGVAFLKIV